MPRSPFSPRNLLPVVFCASGLLALAGCGGASSQGTRNSSPGSTAPGNTPSSATATPAHTTGGPVSNICPLITPAELQQITGITYNSGIVVNPGGAPAPGETKEAHCAYQQTVNHVSNVGESVIWFDTPADAGAMYTGLRTNYATEGAQPVDVSGVGDRAFSFVGGLFVLKGNILYLVTYVAPSAQRSDATADAKIANIVLPQL